MARELVAEQLARSQSEAGTAGVAKGVGRAVVKRRGFWKRLLPSRAQRSVGKMDRRRRSGRGCDVVLLSAGAACTAAHWQMRSGPTARGWPCCDWRASCSYGRSYPGRGAAPTRPLQQLLAPPLQVSALHGCTEIALCCSLQPAGSWRPCYLVVLQPDHSLLEMCSVVQEHCLQCPQSPSLVKI